MVTTDNEIFNKVMDTVLSPEDRKLMVVTPKGVKYSVGFIAFQPDTIAAMKQMRDIHINNLEAIDTLIMLSELGARLGVTVCEK